MDIDAVRTKSLARYKQERDWFILMREAAKQMPGEVGRLQEKLLDILLDSKETVVDCVENEKPFSRPSPFVTCSTVPPAVGTRNRCAFPVMLDEK